MERFQEKLAPYKNTLVIDDFFNIVRLVDVIDGGDDYYWVYDSPKGIMHTSCFSGWTPLKGFIPDEAYKKMLRIWNLNNKQHAE